MPRDALHVMETFRLDEPMDVPARQPALAVAAALASVAQAAAALGASGKGVAQAVEAAAEALAIVERPCGVSRAVTVAGDGETAAVCASPQLEVTNAEGDIQHSHVAPAYVLQSELGRWAESAVLSNVELRVSLETCEELCKFYEAKTADLATPRPNKQLGAALVIQHVWRGSHGGLAAVGNAKDKILEEARQGCMPRPPEVVPKAATADDTDIQVAERAFVWPEPERCSATMMCPAKLPHLPESDWDSGHTATKAANVGPGLERCDEDLLQEVSNYILSHGSKEKPVNMKVVLATFSCSEAERVMKILRSWGW